MIERHNRHTASQVTACASLSERHKRHTPLKGCDGVTVGRAGFQSKFGELIELVPMPPFLFGWGVGGRGFPFALCCLWLAWAGVSA